MPKKTKKQKILAERRRMLATLKTSEKNHIHKKKGEEIPDTMIKTITSHQPDYNRGSVYFTISDLKKTVMISLFILALEFLIFYASLKGS